MHPAIQHISNQFKKLERDKIEGIYLLPLLFSCMEYLNNFILFKDTYQNLI